MPNYLLYSDNVETIEPDEQETEQKIIEVMTDGMNKVRENVGRNVRISHAKAFGLLKGTLTVEANLPSELAQGLFAQPRTYQVLVRLASAPGEINDDSKLNTVRGMAVKVLDVTGPKLAGHTADTQDFVFDTGKEFLTGGPKAFLQAFKPNAEIAPKLSDTVKGAVSGVARVTNAALNAVGANSEKLDFYGHPKQNPMTDAYYSQTPFRYGDYIAKIGFVPDSPGYRELMDKQKDHPYDPETFNALREATEAFFRTAPAEFKVVVQLNTGLEEMPIEDAQAKWPEESSQYQTVGRLTLPVQNSFDPEREGFFEDLSFSPDHSLAAHRPLGGINRARLVVYKVMSERRLSGNGKTVREPSEAETVPA